MPNAQRYFFPLFALMLYIFTITLADFIGEAIARVLGAFVQYSPGLLILRIALLAIIDLSLPAVAVLIFYRRASKRTVASSRVFCHG